MAENLPVPQPIYYPIQAPIDEHEIPNVTIQCSRQTRVTGPGQPCQADSVLKYLVLPNFPERYDSPIICHWEISSMPGTFLQIYIRELSIPCTASNRLVIIDGEDQPKPICGLKNPPVIVSRNNTLEVKLFLADPGPKVIILISSEGKTLV